MPHSLIQRHQMLGDEEGDGMEEITSLQTPFDLGPIPPV